MISSGHEEAQVVLHVLGIAAAGERPDAGDDGNAVGLDAFKEIFQQAQIEDRRVMAYSAPASTL